MWRTKSFTRLKQHLTFFASCVRGLVPAKSVNQLLMELCDLAVTSEKLSFWLTCGLRLPVSGNVLYRSFSAMMLLKLELICKGSDAKVEMRNPAKTQGNNRKDRT